VTRRGPAALAATALLAACASVAPVVDPQPWTSGRLSLRIDAIGTTPARREASAFDLRGSAERGELRLNSPLGLQIAAARWAPGLAVLTTSEGERRFDSLDDLSRAALGEALPLAALPDWLAGRPWSGAGHLALDDGFEQAGWRVVLARRTEGWIEARRESPPAVTVRVRLDNPERTP
jgi:outer membrane lipoprotein LolB